MDPDQRERLEQELRFLKESLDAEVISKEEYERGKQRIDNKLNMLEGQEEETVIDSDEQHNSPEEHIEIKELRQETPKRSLDASKEEKKEIETALEQYDSEEEHEKPSEESEDNLKESPDQSPKSDDELSGIKFSKPWLYGILTLIVLVGLFFLMRWGIT